MYVDMYYHAPLIWVYLLKFGQGSSSPTEEILILHFTIIRILYIQQSEKFILGQ